MTKFNWLTPEVLFFLERFDFLDTQYIYIPYTYNVYIINNNNLSNKVQQVNYIIFLNQCYVK